MSSARHFLMQLIDLIDRILEDLEGERWRFTNARQMLVYGNGGIGKSHLLADATAYQIECSRPALLLLGSKFVDGDPWRQILDELDLPRHYQIKHVLGALDAAAQVAGTRALVTIDALNERHGTDIWPHRLAGLLQDIEPFPRVSFVLSCRTTYLDHVIPASLAQDVLPRLAHHGFSGDAARAYLQFRGFTVPGTPHLMPEFSNPLFLRTCCDALEKEGKQEFPRGLHGVSAIFGFYKNAVSRAVNTRLELEPRRRVVERAIDALAGAFVSRGIGYVPVDEAFRLLDEILPTGGARDRDLLSQLESEGILTVEMMARGDEPVEEVRFTFERFSDHAIATKLLDTHLDEKHPKRSFALGSPLHSVVAGQRAYRNAGVIDAIAIQLPERAGVELLDVVPSKTSPSWSLREAFSESLLWRDQKRFTKRTLELVRKVGGDHMTMTTLVAVATEPDNRFNAHYLHSRLLPISMPTRDALWSSFIAQEGEDGGDPTEMLIDWALAIGFSPIDAHRAELAAIVITWFLTTTNRAVRDRATKALAALLAPRLALAVTMLEHFSDVDDGYLLERLVAAIYGAAMQGMAADDAVMTVAHTLYRKFFAAGTPPVNVLIRDHGRGLIEYALWRGCLPDGVDLAKVRPPYQSPWPIEPVPDAVIEKYTGEYKDGTRFHDQITASSTDHGDFARYVIDYHVHDWSPAPIGTTDLPTDEDLKEAWPAEFQEIATPTMRSAYENLRAAGRAASPWSKSAELQEAECAFRQAIGDDAWEEYRVRSQSWFGQSMFQFHPAPHRPAHFNLAWARRWICKRAHDLGWSAELHGEFDRSQPHPYARQGHRVERIGKKYQWLALYQLRASMADNLAFLPSSFSYEPQAYEGEWQGSLRDVDPSLLLSKTRDDGWTDWTEPTWWMPIAPKLKPIPAQDRLQWRDGPDDIVNGEALIDVVGPGGRRWLTLYSCPSWDQWAVINGHL